MRKFLTSMIVTLTFLLVIGCSKTPEKEDDLYQKGFAEIEEMNFEKARNSFDKIGETDSNSVYSDCFVPAFWRNKRQYFFGRRLGNEIGDYSGQNSRSYHRD